MCIRDRASGFYATAADTSYKLYVVKNFENEYSFKNKTLVAEGLSLIHI